jgi:quinol monooxygenase YgiN
MAVGLILEFSGIGKAEYDAIDKMLGTDMYTKTGDIPAGLITHSAGTSDRGTFIVSETWESRAAQEAFMQSRLGEALQRGGVTQPPTIVWTELLVHQEF